MQSTITGEIYDVISIFLPGNTDTQNVRHADIIRHAQTMWINRNLNYPSKSHMNHTYTEFVPQICILGHLMLTVGY